MATLKRGNLLQAGTEALVNTVNCVGFMGKGIALQFKKAFPANFKAYERACRAGEVQPGRMLVFPTGTMVNPKYIINFPTKRDWRGNARIEDIEAGLKALVSEVCRLRIKSIAVPPLGCGLGGLDWRQVRPLIERAFAAIEDVHVDLFGPVGAPEPASMPVGKDRPGMTAARALLVRLLRQYAEVGYKLTLLEIQKLAYFLQEAGEPLKLVFVAHLYGPYAHNLNKLLERVEGHFIRGYGDNQKPDVEITLLRNAVEEADSFLAGREECHQRLARVADVINGFETPYGMELLSSVHWVATHGEPPARTAEGALAAVQGWNERKRKLLKADDVRVAWHRLTEKGWVSEETGKTES